MHYFGGVRHPPCLWIESGTPMTSQGERRLAGKAGARPWQPEPPREASSLSEQKQRFRIQRASPRLLQLPPHQILLQSPPWQAGARPFSWGRSQEALGRHSGQNTYICLIFLLRSQCNDSEGIKQKATGTTGAGKGVAQIPSHFWKLESG